MSEGNTTLSGIGVSAGVAVGPLVIVSPPPSPPANEAPTTDAAAAGEKVRDTLKAVGDGLLAKAANADAHAKPILEAGAMMAADPGLAGAIDTQLQTGKGITNAVSAAVDEYCAMFESLGGYMAERVTDLYDVRDRAIARLLGQAEPGVPTLTTPSILAAHDLAPAETATLTTETCLGIVTSGGGATSHTAILAAQLGIPAVVQAIGILNVPSGTIVAIDGGGDGLRRAEATVDLVLDAHRQARIARHQGARLQDRLGVVTGDLDLGLQAAGDIFQDAGDLRDSGRRIAGSRLVGGCGRGWGHHHQRPDGRSGTDANAVEGAVFHRDACYSASRSRESSSTRLSSAASAPSPSAVRVTVSPCLAPSAMTIRMLLASTGLPPSLATVTGRPVAVTA